MRNNLPLKYVFLSGSFAGLCADFISIPLEHIKIKIQTQTSFKYKGSIDCFVSIAKNHGFLKLYTGS